MPNKTVSRDEEARKARRKIQASLTCTFDDSPIEFQIYELSAHGFSFLCEKKLCFFKKGAILERISIHNSANLEIINGSGHVVHDSDFDVNRTRIGVVFTKRKLDRTMPGIVRLRYCLCR